MTAQCSHRSPRGTQCRRSALDGAEACRAHAPGYVAPKRAARTVAAVPAGTVPGLSGHARVVALAELAHEATSAAVSERAHGLAADLAEDACIAWVRSVSAALAWLLDDSTASAVSLAHQPAGRVAEPVEAVEPDAMARDPRVAPRCGDCGECAICDAVLAYEDRAQDPRDAHEAPLAHESADDPRRHTDGPVVDVAGGIDGALDHEDDMRESEPPPASLTFHVACLDCVSFLASLEDESVDLIVTDPAYESLEKHRSHGTTTRLTADWFAIFKNECFPDLLRECFRVLKPDAHLYVYSDQETMFATKPMAEAAGFTWWKHLVWSKTKRDGDEPAAGMGYHYRASHEVIGFYEKGKRRLNDLGVCDVLPAPRVKGYPTEKPVSISRTLIEQSSAPGELVVDCFMGSASVGEAALLSGRRFAGCDVAERSIALARERLKRAGGVEVGPPSVRAQRSLFG